MVTGEIGWVMTVTRENCLVMIGEDDDCIRGGLFASG